MSPCNYSDYHPDWKSIRRQILDQADHCCEFCGVANMARGRRDEHGVFVTADEDTCDEWFWSERRCFRIVLTIAHLCHDTTCYDPTHLRALCQKCHLAYDVEHHRANAAQTLRFKKVAAGQMQLVGD